MPVIFGEVIKKLRKKKGWSQMHLAMEAGLHLNALGHLERGQRTPNLQTVLLIARALNVPAGEIVAAVERAGPHLR